MNLKWINTAILLATAATLCGCATSKEELMPHDDAVMLDIWNQNTAGSSTQAARQLLDARQTLRRPLTGAEVQAKQDENADFTRNAANEIYRQFKRLPNPDLLMYVFPHLAGTDPVPVPGYSTVFPFYQRVQYAMPGERTEEY